MRRFTALPLLMAAVTCATFMPGYAMFTADTWISHCDIHPPPKKKVCGMQYFFPGGEVHVYMNKIYVQAENDAQGVALQVDDGTPYASRVAVEKASVHEGEDFFMPAIEFKGTANLLKAMLGGKHLFLRFTEAKSGKAIMREIPLSGFKEAYENTLKEIHGD